MVSICGINNSCEYCSSITLLPISINPVYWLSSQYINLSIFNRSPLYCQPSIISVLLPNAFAHTGSGKLQFFPVCARVHIWIFLLSFCTAHILVVCHTGYLYFQFHVARYLSYLSFSGLSLVWFQFVKSFSLVSCAKMTWSSFCWAYHVLCLNIFIFPTCLCI